MHIKKFIKNLLNISIPFIGMGAVLYVVISMNILQLEQFIIIKEFLIDIPVIGATLLLDGEYAGGILLAMGILTWIVMIWILKMAIFDTLFPKIRVVDSYKNTITYARRVLPFSPFHKHTDNSRYLMVKFKLFPMLRWHEMKLPAPDKVKWRRMPFSIDLITEDIYLNWNDKEDYYQLGKTEDLRIPDTPKWYEELSMENIRNVASNVNEGVRGDFALVKDQYQAGIPITPEMAEKPVHKRKKQESKGIVHD